MGKPKSKSIRPNYPAMARNYAQWEYEDAQWRENALAEATNVHNREKARAKARYASSGGSTDKIAEIEAEHKKKLEETHADIEKRYKEKQQILKAGPTYAALSKYFTSIRSHEIGQQAGKLEEGTEREQFLKENQARLIDITTPAGGDVHYSTPTRYVARFQSGSPAVSDEMFSQWVTGLGGYKPPEKEKPEMEQIKTRLGEKPRAPIMGSIPVEENPWI